MTRGARFAASAVAVLLFAAVSARDLAIADPATPTFKRGATLVEFFEFPKIVGTGAGRTYADPAYPDPLAALNLFDFDELHRIGFDHMRVPLDVGPLMQGDEAEQRDILDRLVAVVSAINRHGLAVLVTLFPPSLHHELPQTYLDGLDGPKFRAYAATVERVATALGAVDSGAVALEPMNEPQSQCRIHFGTDWTAYQQILVERIRRIAAQLPLFLTGGCWSNIEGHRGARRRAGSRPAQFHQRAFLLSVPVHASERDLVDALSRRHDRRAVSGVGGKSRRNAGADAGALSRRGAAASADRAAAEAQAEAAIGDYFRQAQGPAQIEEWMNKVADWQTREGVDSDRIVFTEFGAMKQTIDGKQIDRASRARWLRDTSAAIASHGWGWTVYVLRDDPFGLYVNESDRSPDPELMRALHLDASAAPAE